MEIKFKRSFKLVDNGDLTQNLHSLCYQNNTLISEVDLGNVEDILTQLKKQKEINKKAIEYIAICLRDSEENENYPINKNDLNNLLSILEDKEV